ncbi:MAG: hypothetical protein JXR23_10465 [Pontiellaceae bacterium]|nr:hypothetical protein [Pontiellaceae bacterium]
MYKITIMFVVLFCNIMRINAQGFFERYNSQHADIAIPIFMYEETPSEPMKISGFATGSIYGVPITTNTQEKAQWLSVVTAKHVLINKSSSSPVSGLIVKIGMSQEQQPRYLKIPLKHSSPQNYWTSPSGLDICVIPIPPESIANSKTTTLRESQIATPEVHKNIHLEPGLLVEAISIQPEYLDTIDYIIPQNIPTVRFGHLSRVGFMDLPNGNTYCRSHVIDMHSGPGNSGATVIIHIPTNIEGNEPGKELCKYMFLGIIMGYKEEKGSYIEYDAEITNRVKETSLTLVSSTSSSTNTVALSVKTMANPDLTYVVPVYELANIRNSDTFQAALIEMAKNRKEYAIMNSIK